MGLRQLHRRDTQLALQDSTQVSIADAKFAGELRHPTAVERPGSDPVCRHSGESRHRVTQGSAWCQLRPAAEARPDPARSAEAVEEPAPLMIGDASGADRPAVNAGRGDAHEENAVEPRVTRVEGAFTHVGAEGDWQAQNVFSWPGRSNWSRRSPWKAVRTSASVANCGVVP